MAKIELYKRRDSLRYESATTLAQKSSVSCAVGYSIHSVMMQCLLCLIFILLLVPNLSSAALPTVQTLPPLTYHLHLPSGVAVGDDEKIYVVEPNMSELHVFSKAGQHQGAINGVVGIASVAVDSIGRIYVGNVRENGKSNVEVYGADLSFIGMLGMGEGEFRSPIGITVDSAGLIYVVDGRDSEVKVYNADRSFNFSFGSKGTGDGQFQLPTSIVINEITSEILIPDFTALTESARVQVFDLNGVFLRSFATTGTNELGETVAFIRPFGIAVDTLDRIYVTDGYQNVVTVYDTLGNYLGKLYDSNRPLRNPMGIAFAPGSSRLFVASLNTKSVETYGIDSVYGSIAVSLPSHNFGSVTVNELSATQSFNVSNDGSGNLAIGAVTLTGANASEFSIVSNNCADTTLVPTAGCVIEVQFKPLTAGSKNASLSIISDDIYAPTLDVVLSGNAESPQHQLTISKDGAGDGLVQATGINCGTTCTNDYPDGTVVSLLVLPNQTSAFVGWSGGGCTGTASCVVTMAQAVAVTATFDTSLVPPVSYSVIASAGANGSISPVGTVEALENTAVTFSIAADAGYHITEVLIDGVSVGPMDNFTFTHLDANHTVVAEFSTTKSLSPSAIEMGEVSVGHEWKRVDLSTTFVDPVVVVKPASLNDASPAVVRVRNVDVQAFEVRIQEWNYLNDLQGNDVEHAEEQVSYIVMERGSYILEDGTRVEAGRFDTDVSTFMATTSFTDAFTVSPVVMSSIVTYNNDDAVISRMSNAGVSGFGHMLQKEEISTQPFAVETVSYIAWEPSQGSQNGISFEVGRVADVNSQQTTAIAFSGSYTNQPLFIADLQTRNGGAINLRWSDKSATGTSVLLDQEQSLSISTSINEQRDPILAASSVEDLGYLVLWKDNLRPHTLTVEKRGHGDGQVQAQGINCGADCSEAYGDGAVVSLSAVAAEGSFFARWYGGGCSGRQSCVVTMNQAITVIPVFHVVHDLTVATDGLGSGQVLAQGIDCGTDCNETYYSGTRVTLSVVAADGSAFTGWSGGGCRGAMSSCVVNMGQAATVTASFALDADGDGLPDSYEEQYAFLDPQNASDAGSDQDSDGVTNLQEFQIGSDPTKDDADRDGLSDKYEFDNNLDPTDGKCPAWVCGGSGGWRHALYSVQ